MLMLHGQRDHYGGAQWDGAMTNTAATATDMHTAPHAVEAEHAAQEDPGWSNAWQHDPPPHAATSPPLDGVGAGGRQSPGSHGGSPPGHNYRCVRACARARVRVRACVCVI